MKAQYKLAIGLLPYLAAGGLASAFTYPAFLDDQSKGAELATKQEDNDRVLKKLKDRTNIEKEKQKLEAQIEQLRGAVPKTPELDLLVLDLEKMCHESKVDLMGVENLEAEALRQLPSSEEEMAQMMADTDAHLGLGGKKMEKPQVKPQPAKEKKKDDSIGLKQLIRQVYATGDYGGIVDLMKKLESYQRVLNIKQVSLSLPTEITEIPKNAASERAKKFGVLRHPIVSFILTVYYLP